MKMNISPHLLSKTGLLVLTRAVVLGGAFSGWFTISGGTFYQTIIQLWNSCSPQSGRTVTVTDASYNRSIPAAGQAISSAPGFNGS